MSKSWNLPLKCKRYISLKFMYVKADIESVQSNNISTRTIWWILKNKCTVFNCG